MPLTGGRSDCRLRDNGFVGDLRGGLTTAVVMIAIEGSYGLIAFAPLGTAHRSFAFPSGGPPRWGSGCVQLPGLADAN